MGDHPHFDPLDLLTINQVVRLTKRARSTIYEDINQGRLKVVHLGRSTRIPRVELERYVYGDTSGNHHEE